MKGLRLPAAPTAGATLLVALAIGYVAQICGAEACHTSRWAHFDIR